MGVAGNLNDEAAIPGPVRSFYPNDFGLYNMAGNVSEWVADVYRPMHSLTLRDVDNQDLNPFDKDFEKDGFSGSTFSYDQIVFSGFKGDRYIFEDFLLIKTFEYMLTAYHDYYYVVRRRTMI